jgi:hypothetical protein
VVWDPAEMRERLEAGNTWQDRRRFSCFFRFFRAFRSFDLYRHSAAAWLKAAAGKRPVDLLVIDHIEQPTPN